MTVAELINELSEYPHDAIVVVENEHWGERWKPTAIKLVDVVDTNGLQRATSTSTKSVKVVILA